MMRELTPLGLGLAFTILLYLGDNNWLIPAIISYIFLIGLIFWGNKKLYYVPYKNTDGT